ncbi:MAG: hypothetical protein MOP51_2576 [Citricoccus sp.]|nr:hypothetical protein [Citricoccus sp. WCRC_4]
MTSHDPTPRDPDINDPEAQALEDEITRGTLHDHHRDHEFDGTSGRGSTTAVGTRTAPDGIRTGTLVWGIIALLVALWSLSTTVLDWDIDPALVLICLAALGGLVLVAGGIAGATRKGH